VPIDIVLGIIFAYQTVDLFLNKSFRLLVDKKQEWLSTFVFGIINMLSTLFSMIMVAEIVVQSRIQITVLILVTVGVALQSLCMPVKYMIKWTRCGKRDCYEQIVLSQDVDLKQKVKMVLANIGAIIEAVVTNIEFALFNILFILILFNEVGSFTLVVFDIALLLYWLSFDYYLLQLLKHRREQASDAKEKVLPCRNCCCTLDSMEYLNGAVLVVKYLIFVIVVVILALSKAGYFDSNSARTAAIVVTVFVVLFTILQIVSYQVLFWSIRYKVSEYKQLPTEISKDGQPFEPHDNL
jgi:hypothetical protein